MLILALRGLNIRVCGRRGAQKEMEENTLDRRHVGAIGKNELYNERGSLSLCFTESQPYLKMGKRKHTSVHSSQRVFTNKRQKLTSETPGQRALSMVEVLDRIIRSVPKDKVRNLRGVSIWFRQMIEYGPVREYLYDVPPKGKVGVLLFRGEKIGDYVYCIAPGSQPSLEQTHESCIQGYGGEGFINRDDEAYRDITLEDTEMILENQHCARPCLLDSTRLACSNLSPGPFKRLMYTLLAKAWEADGVVKSEPTVLSKPSHFKITCDARIFGDIEWEEYCMSGEFSKPWPNNSFEATVNWVFDLLALYSGTRNDLIYSGAAIDDMDYLKGTTLGNSELKKAFRVARGTSWSLEQTCYIVDRIPERPCAQPAALV
jgi:hypothetical protein